MSETTFGIIAAHAIALIWIASCERDVEPLISDNKEAGNYENHEDSAVNYWDSALVVPIMLNGNSIEVNASTAIVDGSRVTITAAGTYKP